MRAPARIAMTSSPPADAASRDTPSRTASGRIIGVPPSCFRLCRIESGIAGKPNGNPGGEPSGPALERLDRPHARGAPRRNGARGEGDGGEEPYDARDGGRVPPRRLVEERREEPGQKEGR